MNEKENTIGPVATGIFTLPPYEQNPPQLIGGMCGSCSRYYFPRPHYCKGCLEPTEEALLGSEGTIYSYTVIRTKAPLGLPTPYAVGYVDLKGSSLRIFTLLDPRAIEDLKVGQSVHLAVNLLGHDGKGSPCLRPYFTPCKVI
jgi:uncharacterized OB-fold protein